MLPLIVFLILFFFCPQTGYPQIGFRINGEFGLYKSTGEESFKQNDILTRIDGSIKYSYQDVSRKASVQLRGRPEFYKFRNSISSVKIKAEGNFSQQEDNFLWGADLSNQKNFFKGRGLNVVYDILFSAAHFEWSAGNENSIQGNLGYGYQNVDNEGNYKLDLFFSDFMLFKAADRYLKYGFGIYLERFLINSKSYLVTGVSSSELDLMNNGWRYGPELSFSFLKNLIISSDYRFLIHESKYTKNLSYEHWIRFVAGTLFLDDWSVFLLADYYFRRFRLIGNPQFLINPLYSPLNLENRVYLKLARSLNENLEVYIKTGYFKDNLYENEFSIEGWNALVGIELNME